MKSRCQLLMVFPLVFAVLLILHFPLLRLPYYWDEAGYYIPAAFDFYRSGLLIPRLTLPTGHTPLVMVYLGVLWKIFGFSELVTRAAMILVAAAAVVATYALGRRVAGREAGAWAAALLALSPLFFAQSSLAFLDLTAALFTTLAVFWALDGRWALFALAASLAVMSKETAVILLPGVWAFLLFRGKAQRASAWALTTVPALVLALWAGYYHRHTGFWTGNAGYLQYNLYSAFTPLHVARSLLARMAEVLVQGFNGLLVAGAAAGIWWAAKHRPYTPSRGPSETSDFTGFLFLALGLIGVYVVTLSVVGGAILPRYLLPAFPVFYILAVHFITQLPRPWARGICIAAGACFVASWFINPPYPFPYEDNISYATFVRLHQRAARYLESLPGDPVILTAWPATDELEQPFLGYVDHPLRVAQVDGFTPDDFGHPPRFDVLYLYSRRWNPAHNWLVSVRLLRAISVRFYGYEPAVPPGVLASRFHLKLLKAFRSHGQWASLYGTPTPPFHRAVMPTSR